MARFAPALATAGVVLDRLSKALSCVALMGLVGIALFVLAEGISRWLLAVTFPGLLDVSQLLLPVIVAACFPAALMRRHHITVRFLGEALGARATWILDVIGALLLLVCIALISMQLFAYAWDAAKNRDVTWALRLRVAPTWFASAAAMGLAAVAQLLVCVQDLFGAGKVDSAGVGDESI